MKGKKGKERERKGKEGKGGGTFYLPNSKRKNRWVASRMKIRVFHFC